MKKIVAYVSPLTTISSEEIVVQEENKAEMITMTDPDNSTMEEKGIVKFEVVLPDEQMQRVVDTLMQSEEVEEMTRSLIEELLRFEMQHYSEETPSLLNRILEDVERELLGQTFKECHQIKTKTAARLGIDRNTLHKKLLKYGLIKGENV